MNRVETVGSSPLPIRPRQRACPMSSRVLLLSGLRDEALTSTSSSAARDTSTDDIAARAQWMYDVIHLHSARDTDSGDSLAEKRPALLSIEHYKLINAFTLELVANAAPEMPSPSIRMAYQSASR